MASKVYVLINVERGAIDSVVAEIQKLPAVVDCSAVTGRYDIIVKLEGKNLEELLAIVVKRLHKLSGIIKTESLVHTEIEPVESGLQAIRSL